MAQAQYGSAEKSKICTGRALFKISGDTCYHDLGSLSLHKYRDDQEEVAIMRASKGKRKVVGSRVTKIDRRYALTGEEETELAVRLQLGAAAPVASNQSIATGSTAQFAGVHQGAVLDLNAHDVTINTFEVSSVAKTGYTLDAKAGLITITVGGDVTEGATVDIDFDAASETRRLYTAGDDTQLSGHLIFLEEDQLSDIPRREWRGNAQLRLTSSGDQDGNKIANYEYEVLFTSDPTILERDGS